MLGTRRRSQSRALTASGRRTLSNVSSGAVRAGRRARDEIDERRSVVAKLATEFGATLVEFQAMFDAAVAAGTSPDYWAKDGVHPTPAGHALMAREWAKSIGESSNAKL